MDIFGDLGGGSIWDDPTFVTVRCGLGLAFFMIGCLLFDNGHADKRCRDGSCSAVSEIVTREDGSITLEELLDQDELIQEAKGQLPRLLELCVHDVASC